MGNAQTQWSGGYAMLLYITVSWYHMHYRIMNSRVLHNNASQFYTHSTLLSNEIVAVNSTIWVSTIQGMQLYPCLIRIINLSSLLSYHCGISYLDCDIL